MTGTGEGSSAMAEAAALDMANLAISAGPTSSAEPDSSTPSSTPGSTPGSSSTVASTSSAAPASGGTASEPASSPVGEGQPHAASDFQSLKDEIRKLYRVGLYEEALDKNKQLLELKQKGLASVSQRDVAVARVLHQLDTEEAQALYLYWDGQHEASEAISRRLVGLRQRVQGMDDPDTVTTMYTQALALKGLDKVTEAKVIFKQVVQLRQQTLGMEDPDTIESVIALAGCLGPGDQADDAERMLTSMLQLSTKIGNPVLIEAAAIRLARLLRDLNRHSGAEPYFRQALDAALRFLPEDHPERVARRYDVGYCLMNQGKNMEALELLLQSVREAQTMLGPWHETTYMALTHAGRCLFLLRAYSEAEILMRKSLTVGKHVFGPDSPSVTLATQGLVACLQAQGKIAEAAALLPARPAASGGHKTRGRGRRR